MEQKKVNIFNWTAMDRFEHRKQAVQVAENYHKKYGHWKFEVIRIDAKTEIIRYIKPTEE